MQHRAPSATSEQERGKAWIAVAVAVWLAACGAVARQPRPAAVPAPAATPSASETTVREPAPPEVSEASVEAPPAAEPEPPPAATGDAGPTQTPAPGPRARFLCFSWVHGPDFSTDCFRSSKECEAERRHMKDGARDTTPTCRAVEGASCSVVTRPPAKAANEHCFGSASNCERYRAYVTGNGLTASPCADR